MNMGDVAAQQPATRLIRSQEVMRLTTWSRTTLWRRVRSGDFIAPVTIGNNIGWYAHEVEEWLQNRPRASYAPIKTSLEHAETTGGPGKGNGNA